jgi:hypothetical protein
LRRRGAGGIALLQIEVMAHLFVQLRFKLAAAQVILEPAEEFADHAG